MAQQQLVEHDAFIIHPSVSRDRARVFAFMSPDRVKHIIDDLPCGWTVYGVRRKSGRTAGKSDLYLYSPDGQKFRSGKEIKRYIETQNQVLTGEETEQSSFPEEEEEEEEKEDLLRISVFAEKRKLSLSSKNSQKIQISQTPPASSPVATIPNEKKRGRPHKMFATSADDATPLPADVKNPARPGDVPPKIPATVSKRKQRNPMKSLGTFGSDQNFSSDDSIDGGMINFLPTKKT